MNAETKIVWISIVAAFVALGLFHVGYTLTRPDCPPGLTAKLFPKVSQGGGWRCILSQPLS